MVFHPGLINFLQCSRSLFWLQLMGEVPVECGGTQAQTQQFEFFSQVMPPSLNRVLKNSSEITLETEAEKGNVAEVLCFVTVLKKIHNCVLFFSSKKLYLRRRKRIVG